VTLPIACVLAVVCRGDEVLLVKRANTPDQGKWGFPGGKIEFGETVPAAALRELREETGIEAEARAVIEVIDFFDHKPVSAPGSLPDRHFVLIAVRCDWVSGAPVAADDALDARWWPIAEIAGLEASTDVERVARMAIAAG